MTSVRAAAVVMAAVAMIATQVGMARATEEPILAGFTPSTTLESAASSSDQQPWHNAVLVAPSGDAVVVYTHGSDLRSRYWDAAVPAWRPAQQVADDGAFAPTSIGSEPAAAVSGDGHALMSWPAEPGTANAHIEVALLTFGTDTSWATLTPISGYGAHPTEPAADYGADGTAAVAWLDDTGVEVTVRDAATGHWSNPAVVSPVIDTNRVPTVDQPAVVVSSSGQVTVTWWTFDPTDGANGAYRMQVSTRDSNGTWADPSWLTPAGTGTSDVDPVAPATLVASTDGSIGAAWNGLVAVRDANGWSTATPLEYTDGTPPRLARGRNGEIVAVWTVYVDKPHPHRLIRTSTYTPGSGWSQAIRMYTAGGDNPVDPSVAVDQYGTIWATWRQYDAGTGHWDLLRAYRRLGTDFTLPDRITDETHVADYSSGFSADGHQVLTYDIEKPSGSDGTQGLYTLKATAALLPLLSMGDQPRISGAPAAGHELVLSNGAWAPAPTIVSVVWQRRGTPYAVSAASYPVTAADAGHVLDVTLTVAAARHRNTTWTGSITVARLAAHLATGGATRTTEGRSIAATATLSVIGGTVPAGSTAQLYTRPATGGPWHRAASAALNGGTAKISFTPRVTTQYQWRFTGTRTLAPTTSATRTVIVIAVVHAHLTRTRPHVGTLDMIWGRIGPSSASSQVAIQRHYAGAWHTIAHATVARQTLPDGRRSAGYSWQFRVRRPGSYGYRVVRWAGAGVATGVSRTLTLTTP